MAICCLCIEALERFRRGEGQPALFAKVPPPLTRKIVLPRELPADIGRKGVAAFFGTWPGDESLLISSACSVKFALSDAVPDVPYLLDTNVILNLVRTNPLGRYIDSAFHLSSARRRPLVSIVSHGELPVMADRNGWGESKREIPEDLEAALSQFAEIAPDLKS